MCFALMPAVVFAVIEYDWKQSERRKLIRVLLERAKKKAK